MSRLLVLSLLLAGCAQKSELTALEGRVKDLEDKLSAGAGAAAAPGAKAAPAAAANPEREEAAGKLMQEAQAALKENDYATAKTKFAELTTNYADTRPGKSAMRMAPEVNLVGAAAPPIEAEKWFQGQGDFSNSQATLLVFWEVWCPHCKKEMPKLAEEEAKWKAKGVQIIAMTKVTKSATDESVAAFLKESKVNFPVGKEANGSMSKGYAVTGIPAAALVKDGKVLWRGHPARLDDATVDKLLAG